MGTEPYLGTTIPFFFYFLQQLFLHVLINYTLNSRFVYSLNQHFQQASSEHTCPSLFHIGAETRLTFSLSIKCQVNQDLSSPERRGIWDENEKEIRLLRKRDFGMEFFLFLHASRTLT